MDIQKHVGNAINKTCEQQVYFNKKYGTYNYNSKEISEICGPYNEDGAWKN